MTTTTNATEWMKPKEVAAYLRRVERDAKRILKRHGVPIVEHTQRDWEVRRQHVVGLLDRLEREAAEKLQNEGNQREWLRPQQQRRRPRAS